MTYGAYQIPDLPPKVLDALSRGERNEAIQQLQTERNLNREEARELVASFLIANPSLGRRMKDLEGETRWSNLRWWILLQAIVVAIGYFLLFRE